MIVCPSGAPPFMRAERAMAIAIQPPPPHPAKPAGCGGVYTGGVLLLTVNCTEAVLLVGYHVAVW